MEPGHLVVRASGAEAAAAAILGTEARPRGVQLLTRCPLRASGHRELPDCELHVRPSDGADADASEATVLLTLHRLTIGFGELRPLMFRPVPVEPPVRSLFTGAIGHVLAAGSALDPHGLAHHLHGIAELVLRSTLAAELNRADGRRGQALAYIREHLGDPSLDADAVAGALFISRRRLYQLFDDGQGVQERIRSMRLDHAKALLADPARAGQGIGEIAKACGFVSAAHFSRAFRKAFGRSPSELRPR